MTDKEKNAEISLEEVVDLIKDRVQEIENYRVYYTMRGMKIRYIRDTTVDTVRYCIALQELGLPITAQLVSELEGTTTQSVRNKLHTLGDKHVLTMVRGTKSPVNRWVLNPMFTDKYYGER